MRSKGSLKKKFHVCVAFGTRPEVIKLAPVVRAFRAVAGVRVTVLATGQHRTMMEEAMQVFGLKADVDLRVMKKGQTLFHVTERVLHETGEFLSRQPVDLMVVQGDTATTFACALAAFYRRIPVAHVEAGLRTNDKFRPFPEEMNRRMTTALADLHFAPTPRAARDLKREGVASSKIFMVGNTVVDALLQIVPSARKKGKTGVRRKVLVTLHRRESFGEGLRQVLLAVRDISLFPGVEVVYPVHLNPQVRAQVQEVLSGGRVILREPMAYDDFLELFRSADIVVTDSGGIQEEACTLRKPVLIARERTERQEAIEAGFAELVGFDRKRIVRQARRLLEDRDFYRRRSSGKNPFGDGKSSARIVRVCLKMLQGRKT